MKCIWKKRLCIFLVSLLIWQYGFMSYISYRHINEVHAAEPYILTDAVKKFGVALMLTYLATMKMQNNTMDWFNTCSNSLWWNYYANKLQTAVNNFTLQQWNLLQAVAANYLGNTSYNLQNASDDLGDQSQPVLNTIAQEAASGENTQTTKPYISTNPQYLAGYDLTSTQQMSRNTLFADQKPYTILDITCTSAPLEISFSDYKWSSNDQYYIVEHPLGNSSLNFPCYQTQIVGMIGDTTGLQKFYGDYNATAMYTYTFSTTDYNVMKNVIINSGNTILLNQLQNMTVNYGDYQTIVTVGSSLNGSYFQKSVLWNKTGYFQDALVNRCLGFHDGANRINDFALVGDGSICYYPPVAKDTSQQLSVDAATALVRQTTIPTNTTNVTLPTVQIGTKSVPIDGSGAATGGNTDTTGFWSTLWQWLQKLLDAINSIPAKLQLMWDSIIQKLDSLKLDLSLPNTVSLDFSPLMVASDKFPFCIPFDLINLFKPFNGSAEAPKFHVQFPSMYGIQTGGFDIDFAGFDKLALITRWFCIITFVYGLILETKKIIS